MLTLVPGRDKDGMTELAATLHFTDASTFRLTVALEREMKTRNYATLTFS